MDTDHDLLELLAAAPPGLYIAEVIAGMRLLWRVSDGEPTDQTIAPAPDPMLLPA